MLTWDEATPFRPTDVSVNKVIIAAPIAQGDMVRLVPFGRNKIEDPWLRMYESLISTHYTEVLCVTARCIYEWLFSWVIQQNSTQQPITPEQKAHNARSVERQRCFFGAQKLSMRNAP
jgi:hypothetical protein